MGTRNNFFEHYQADIAVVSSSKVSENDFRLNADFFRDNFSATYKRNLKFVPLDEFASVVGFGPFKRYYIENPEFGVPLISSSEMMEIKPSCQAYISKELHKNYKKYLVDRGWILVSCSGTIGNITIVDNRLNGFAISQHALRIIPKNEKYKGYLYVYLSSEIGQSEVKGKKSGAVIDEIYEHDLSQLQIPIVDDSIIEIIDRLIDNAITLRENANQLLEEANILLYDYNQIPTLNILDAKFFDEKQIIQSRVLNSTEYKLDNRFDAHFYNPIFELNRAGIYQNAKEIKSLNELCSSIFLCDRFPRNFVDKENGIPLIGTKQTMQIRPNEMKYLPKIDVENDTELIIKENWILLARVGSLGGTFGKVAFAWKNYEGYVASDNIIRIVPDELKVDAAYLFCYLQSNAGFNEIVRLRHGALQDALDVNDIKTVSVPLPDEIQQKLIGDKVRLAYEKRSDAVRLEDEAQNILKQTLTQ